MNKDFINGFSAALDLLIDANMRAENIRDWTIRNTRTSKETRAHMAGQTENGRSAEQLLIHYINNPETINNFLSARKAGKNWTRAEAETCHY